MANYQAPLRDMRFVFDEVLNGKQLFELEAYRELGADIVGAVQEEAAKLAQNVFLPLNASGDHEGCSYDPETKTVRTPKGFKEAYKQFAEGGWVGVSSDPEYGGQGLPHIVNAMVEEMACSTNLSLGMYPGLSHSAILLLSHHGSAEMKDKYLARMISGEWSGTMCLTEPQCGTDLGLIKTRAVPESDGSYRLSGTKIWITGGEQDLTDNIIHLVLAKLPDAPDNVKGISLFLVPKFLDDGSRNPAFCGGLEHKMGIKGSATCVMNFEGAKGWLVGEPNKGLRCMFTMMNSARLMVGLQGLGLAETAYQTSLGFAKERLQSRSLAGPQAADKPADPILVHPDVRRMLLRQKVTVEGCRALAYWTGMQLDLSHAHPDPEEREKAEDLLALLTPIVKSMLTDEGYTCIDQAVQSMGGSGFVSDWGVEQLLRDCRIARIYEGTNGIQALDLVGRKLPMHGGRLVQRLAQEVQGFIAANPNAPHIEDLKKAVARLQGAIGWLMGNAMKNPLEVGGAASPFLRLFGLTCLTFMWVRMAVVAEAALAAGTEEESFYQAKLKSAEYFVRKLLPEADALNTEIMAGVAPIMAFAENDF